MSLQMPSRLPLIGKTLSSQSSASRPFVCPSCRFKQARALSDGSARSKPHGNRKALWNTLRTRTASTTASVTAVNARREIPTRFQKVHESLKALETEAPVYINLSQLRLALRGLESENAVTRIAGKTCPNDGIGWSESLANTRAVLGLSGHNGPRRLARALLADPLGQEQQWEKQLTADDNDERAILLRYDLDPLKPINDASLLTMALDTGNRPMWTTDIRS